jgi:hypothetical protein
MKINLTTEQKEIVIRKGTALEPKAEKSITIKGTLQAPFQFLDGKNPDPAKSHILIAADKGEIVLHIQDTDPYTEHVITGKLEQDSILKLFAINSDKRWSVQEFLKFIKTMRFYFSDKSAHQQLIESLQKWSIKVERVITEHNDNKGNSNFQLETKVREVELISKFDLTIPIFQGYEKMKFTVEIGLDPKNTAVQLYLISDEMIELEIGQREKLISSELAKFDSFACSKVYIS